MTRGLRLARMLVLAASLALLIFGLMDGGYRDVLNKAMLLCYECMGIG